VIAVVIHQTKLPDLTDTIVALSSAAGPGARAIVRLSGRRALPIAAALCPEFAAPPPGQLTEARLRLPAFHAAVPADLYYFAAPRTYTGEDLLEIHTISSGPIIDVLIAVCLDAGARAAQPGEFTMRAFLAGKLDLTRAEAVLGVIEAKDRGELREALAQLAGGMTQPLHELREDLLNLLADVEAGLDFADEDLQFVNVDDLLKRIGRGLAHFTLLQRQVAQRSLRQRPFRVVLAGKPNAGKSRLFNALVGADAALVNAEPGTTRDYLERVIDVGGVSVELVDTAGLRETTHSIEAAAQALGKEQARDADLVLWCSACDDPSDQAPTDVLLVRTKADLSSARADHLATSAATGQGLPELRAELAKRVRAAAHAPLAPSLSRCRHHIEACLQHLRNAHALVIHEDMPELLALELRLTLEELGAMVGAVYTDDLLDRIFSRFCIGK
jgi:tRNA modification GTPase